VDLKYKIVVVIVALGVSFAFGRYSVTPPNTKTVETVKTDTKEQTDQNKHIVTVITKDCKTGKEVTTITEDDSLRQREVQKTVDNLLQTVTQQQRGRINISALGGASFSDSLKPVYGVSANKEFIGPITLGAFGLSNGVVGLQIGVNF
jgi:hypothetical protein